MKKNKFYFQNRKNKFKIKKIKMSLDDFVFGKLLGKGSFGSVVIVRRKEDDKQYAMKRVNINHLSEKEKLCSLKIFVFYLL